jgi:hypothetical protein
MKQTSAMAWRRPGEFVARAGLALCITVICFELLLRAGYAQQTIPPPQPTTTEQQIQQLTVAVADAQEQLEASQRQIRELQRQLSALQERVASNTGTQAPQSASTSTPATAAKTDLSQQIDALREQQAKIPRRRTSSRRLRLRLKDAAAPAQRCVRRS